jgi:hypothetical protein
MAVNWPVLAQPARNVPELPPKYGLVKHNGAFDSQPRSSRVPPVSRRAPDRGGGRFALAAAGDATAACFCSKLAAGCSDAH